MMKKINNWNIKKQIFLNEKCCSNNWLIYYKKNLVYDIKKKYLKYQQSNFKNEKSKFCTFAMICTQHSFAISITIINKKKYLEKNNYTIFIQIWGPKYNVVD